MSFTCSHLFVEVGYEKLRKNEDFLINVIEVLLDLPAFFVIQKICQVWRKKVKCVNCVQISLAKAVVEAKAQMWRGEQHGRPPEELETLEVMCVFVQWTVYRTYILACEVDLPLE